VSAPGERRYPLADGRTLVVRAVGPDDVDGLADHPLDDDGRRPVSDQDLRPWSQGIPQPTLEA